MKIQYGLGISLDGGPCFIVIPLYNESARLEDGVGRILSYVRESRPSAEVILVDDGSADDTADAAEAILQRNDIKSGEVIRFPQNRGKGAAVRAGMLRARGSRRLFADADNSTPIEELDRLLPLVETDKTIVIGSRGLSDSNVEVAQPWWRKSMGRIFNLLPRVVLGLPYSDTQCGFKLFGKEAALACFSRQTLERFAFDVELLWIARLHQLPVHEVPVRWIDSPRSTVDPIRDSLHMARDVLKVRFRHRAP